WHPAPHVFEGASIDLLVRHHLDLALALAHRANALGELENRDLFVAANVEDLSLGFARVCQHHHAAYHVADRREASRLLPVPEHEDRFIAKGTRDHVRDHHAVGAGLTRAAGIEAPHDDNGQLALLPVRLSEALVHRLATGVGPAKLVGRAHHTVVVFGERDRD